MEYTSDFDLGHISLFVLPCLSQVWLSAAVYKFRLYFLCQIAFLVQYKNVAKLLLLVNKISHGLFGREVHLSFALQLYCYSRERVWVQVTFPCTMYKENSTWVISCPWLSFLTELYYHLVPGFFSLLNCHLSVKFLLSLNLYSVICLNWSEEHYNLVCLYWWVPVS